MDKPADNEQIQLVATLRALNCSQDEVASALHIAKKRVGEIEDWIKAEPLKSVEAIFDDQALKRVVGRELPVLEEVEPKVLVKAGQVTADDILRHYRNDYPLRAGQPEQQASSNDGQTYISSKGVSEEKLQDHWDRLVMVAETLSLSLTFPSYRWPQESRTGKGLESGGWQVLRFKRTGKGLASGGSRVAGSKVSFSVEKDFLFPRLLCHIAVKFPDFTRKFNSFKRIAFRLLGGGYWKKKGVIPVFWDNTDQVREHHLGRELRGELQFVIEKGTFEDSTCDICESWLVGLGRLNGQGRQQSKIPVPEA